MALLDSLDLQPKDAEQFFNMMTNIGGTDSVPGVDFMNTITKVKGGAMSMDLQCLAYETRLVRLTVDSLAEVLAKVMEDISFSHQGVSGATTSNDAAVLQPFRI